MPKVEHLVVVCRPAEIGDELDAHADWLLIGMSVYQVGTGYGARTEAILAFRRDLDSDERPDGRQRRKSFEAILPKNNRTKPLDKAYAARNGA